MPSLPRRYCKAPGCGDYAVAGSAYCGQHRTFAFKSKGVGGREFSSLYNSARYKQMRKIQLGGHPLCAECARKGLVVAATDCDHIVPHKGDLSLFFDVNNLQSLCHQCHSRKTAKEDGGFGH